MTVAEPLSPYFEARRTQYYDALRGVRERGDFDRWLAPFLDAVCAQAADAVTRAERLNETWAQLLRS